MSYCKKGIDAHNILNNMSTDDLEFTLASCEQNCDKYYQCDTVALMNDELKLKQGECLKCPHCEHYQEFCDCPDLFYVDAMRSKDWNEQEKLMAEINSYGYNIVTCGHCGQVFIHRI